MTADIDEAEITAAEKLRANGHFTEALDLTLSMLDRVHDDDIRMRLLFDVLYCSTRLCKDGLTEWAVNELELLPDPEMSRVFVDFIQAVSCLALGKVQRALDLLDHNLKSEYMELEEFALWKYKHLAYKGSALVGLGRTEEALRILQNAQNLSRNGERETAILIDQANCLLAQNQLEEAFNTAGKVLDRGDEEMATLAMQYMAECRMWQGRVSDALRLYVEAKKRLPSRLVDEGRIQRGIDKCLAYLEKAGPRQDPC